MIRGGVVAAAVTLAIAAGCTDVSTDPDEVVSIGFERVPAPGVVLGDTLRDTTEAVVPLTAQVYNVRGEIIPDAPLTFIALDAGVRIDEENRVIGVGIPSSPVRIVAMTGNLQSAPRTIDVVLRPDSVRGLPLEEDTLRPGTSAASRQSKPFQVRVLHGGATAPADTVVRSYLVRFDITYPKVSAGDVDRVFFADDAGRASRVDTTDARGLASRVIRLGPCGIEVPQEPPEPPSGPCRTPISALDSVMVEVRVVYRPDHPVIHSPVRYTLKVFPTSF